MVEQMGMSDVIGPRALAQQPSSPFAMAAGDGDTLKNKADDEVDRILQEQYDRGMKMLTDNRNILDSIANTLIEKEKIDGVQMLTLIKSMNPDLVSDDAMKTVKEYARVQANTSAKAGLEEKPAEEKAE